MWGAGAKSEYKRSQMKDKLLKQRFSSGIDEENRKRNKKEEGEEGGGGQPLSFGKFQRLFPMVTPVNGNTITL